MFGQRYFARSFYPGCYFPVGSSTVVTLTRELRWAVAPASGRVERALYSSPVVYRFRYERRTKGYQFIDDVTPAIVGASLELNNEREILRTAEFEIDRLAVDDGGEAIVLEPLSDHIAVVMELLVDGSYWLDIPMGLFALKVPRKRYEPSGETWRVTANDLCVYLAQATTTTTYRVAAGQNYITGTNAVKAALDSLGLRHALPSTSLTLPVDMSWPPGTPLLRVVNDLLKGCNFYPLWFDVTGVARTRERDDFSQRTPDVTFGSEDFVLVPIEEEVDDTRFANQVIAVVDDPNRGVLSAVATNADPDSATSTVNLGRTITRVVRADRAADQATLDAIAAAELRTAASMARRAVLLTSLDPRRGEHEVYRLEVPGVYEGEAWWARSWQVQLQTGAEMRHQLARAERVAI